MPSDLRAGRQARWHHRPCASAHLATAQIAAAVNSLPERVRPAVAQQLNPIARLCTADRPNCQVANFSRVAWRERSLSHP
jgi:hypothetical protein